MDISERLLCLLGETGNLKRVLCKLFYQHVGGENIGNEYINEGQHDDFIIYIINSNNKILDNINIEILQHIIDLYWEDENSKNEDSYYKDILQNINKKIKMVEQNIRFQCI